jgi:hypothetical protein
LVSSGLTQDLKTGKIPYREVLLTNVQFSIGDTMMPFSLLVEPTGVIDFEEGFDFSYDKTSMVYYQKGARGIVYKDTIISKRDKPIHLTSFFPPLNQDSTKFISCYDSGFFEWSPHYFYELTYSYILNGVSASKLWQSDSDSIVRIIIPGDVHDEEIHNIFQIDLKQTPVEIQFIKVRHHYNGEFEILNKGTSYVLKQNDIKYLLTEFDKYNFNQDSHFIKLDGSNQFLIEFKTANSYFAGMRNYDNNGRIAENAFPWIVRQLYMKYRKRK